MTSARRVSPHGERVTPNFDRLAGPYRWLETLSFGPWLHRARVHFLPQLSACRGAIVLGDGDGRFTARLLRDNRGIQVTAIDLSPAMLVRLRQAAGPNASRLTTEVADLRQWQPAASAVYDLVVTHFFLDCLTTAEVAALAERLLACAAPNALWLISDFAIPPTRFGRLIAAPLVAILYRVFGLLTGLDVRSLPSHAHALAGAGWTLQSQRHHLRGLLVSEVWHRRAGDSMSPSQGSPSRPDFP